MEQQSPKNISIWQPLAFAIVLAAGILLGNFLSGGFNRSLYSTSAGRVGEVLNYIQKDYVDTVNTDQLVEYSISKMLEKLDPHTTYIPYKEIAVAHSQLEANFEGVGIEFYIIKDTIYVLAPIAGGPSEIAGILAGDRIIKVDSVLVAGVGITSNDVFAKLRGKKGSKVGVTISRRGNKKLLDFTITRNKIPTFSLDAAYMANDSTGYIKISRFSESTYEEFHTALIDLKKQGMTQMILDLKDNPGGYMDMAIRMADDFLDDKKLIVYTIGKDTRFNVRQFATAKGEFEKGALIVLINQGSASASEIVSGALQDNDRALLIGSRSFGKGLVQRPIDLSDGGELRLTISRYYTPSGRCIQKPYDAENPENYSAELSNRFKKGEYFHADSINFVDSLKFKTLKGRTVYGGGGIMPDIFVPRDTSGYTNYVLQLLNKNIVREYALNYYSDNKEKLCKIPFKDFKSKYKISEKMLKEIVKLGTASGIRYREMEFKISKKIVANDLKAYLARSIYGTSQFYAILNDSDEVYLRALKSFPKAAALERGMSRKGKK